MMQKGYVRSASIMCTFLAYEKIESCVPVDLFVIVALFRHSPIFPFRNDRSDSSISRKLEFAGSSSTQQLIMATLLALMVCAITPPHLHTLPHSTITHHSTFTWFDTNLTRKKENRVATACNRHHHN